MDIGVVILIKNILLKNGQHGDNNDRSSKDIGLYISKCPTAFERVVTDTLADARNVNCENIPVMTYPINKPGRYVRFVAYNYYGVSPTLQYIHIDYDYPSGIDTTPFACPGKSHIDKSMTWSFAI